MVGVVIWQVDSGGWRAVLAEGGMGVAANGEQRAMRQRSHWRVESGERSGAREEASEDVTAKWSGRLLIPSTPSTSVGTGMMQQERVVVPEMGGAGMVGI